MGYLWEKGGRRRKEELVAVGPSIVELAVVIVVRMELDVVGLEHERMVSRLEGHDWLAGGVEAGLEWLAGGLRRKAVHLPPREEGWYVD